MCYDFCRLQRLECQIFLVNFGAVLGTNLMWHRSPATHTGFYHYIQIFNTTQQNRVFPAKTGKIQISLWNAEGVSLDSIFI